jgi:nucleoside-diphosphate-sugar epimerase
VGTHLQSLLTAAGHFVAAPSSSDWDLRNALRTDRIVASITPDVVVHLAAHTGLVAADRNPQAVRAVNVAGTKRLIRAIATRAPQARLLMVSTCHVYGPPQILPIPEHHPLKPVGVYARSKKDAEDLVRASALDWVIARPFHLTGPGQPATHAASDWASQASRGATVIRCGDLTLTRDFLDVRDACEALMLLAVRAPAQSTYNICRGQEWRLADVLSAVAPGVTPKVDVTRLRNHDVLRMAGDCSRLRSLGWSPGIEIGESFRALRRAWDDSA